MKPQTNELAQSVRLAMLVRLASIVIGVGGMIGDQLTAQMFICIVLLGATSAAGLLQPGFLDQLTRHPLLAMADVLIVIAVFAVLGVDSPLVLAALKSSPPSSSSYFPPPRLSARSWCSFPPASIRARATRSASFCSPMRTLPISRGCCAESPIGMPAGEWCPFSKAGIGSKVSRAPRRRTLLRWWSSGEKSDASDKCGHAVSGAA